LSCIENKYLKLKIYLILHLGEISHSFLLLGCLLPFKSFPLEFLSPVQRGLLVERFYPVIMVDSSAKQNDLGLITDVLCRK